MAGVTDFTFPRKRQCLVCFKEIVAWDMRDIYCIDCLRGMAITDHSVEVRKNREKQASKNAMPSGNGGIITCRRCGRINCTKNH